MASNYIDEITKLSNLLVANIRFKLDYNNYLNNTRKLLLVEGATDREFIAHVKKDSVDCVIADHVFKSNTVLRTTPTERINCKNAIVKVIYGVSKFKSPFIPYPNDMDKWDIYGLVDLDCEELSAGVQFPRLFITDTHDLETLLLSTDKDILNRIDNCNISPEEITQAFFMAYQLAEVRNLLNGYYDKESFDLSSISCGSHQVDFSFFVEGNKINLCNLVNYITKHSEKEYPSTKIKQIIDRLLQSKLVRKKLSTDGVWKQDISGFDIDAIDEYWIIVNGHDILQLIRYYNEDAQNVFMDTPGQALNRAFESNLIEIYDYSKFSHTSLFEKMNSQEIIAE